MMGVNYMDLINIGFIFVGLINIWIYFKKHRFINLAVGIGVIGIGVWGLVGNMIQVGILH
jgi:hypothetical protein